MSVRVLQVVSHLGHRGTDQQVRFLALGLPRDEFDVHVCALGCCSVQRQALEQMDIPVAILGRKTHATDHRAESWNSPAHLWQLIDHILRLSPQVVHLWPTVDPNAGIRLARLASLFARGMRRPESTKLVFSRWSWASPPERAIRPADDRSLGALDRLLDRFTERIARPGLTFDTPAATGPTYTVGTTSAVGPSSRPNGTLARYVSLPLGVRGQPCDSRSDRCNFFQAAHLPPDTKLIVAYSDYSASSRFKDAIWTADLLKVIRDDTHLVIIGDGPLRWRGERFRDQVRIRDRVHLVTNCCHWERWLPHAHCYWDVDGQEHALPFTAAAMATGIPIVSADTPVSRALLGDKGALYFSLGHRGGLARHCRELLENDDLAESLAAEAHARANRWLSLDQMLSCYASFYRELAG